MPPIKRQYTTKELVAPEDIKSQYYIRITVKDQPGVLGKITTIFGQNQVSILSFIQKPKKEDFVSLVLVTHDTFEGSINKSLEEIQKLDMIDKVKNVIRIENLA